MIQTFAQYAEPSLAYIPLASFDLGLPGMIIVQAVNFLAITILVVFGMYEFIIGAIS